jgi:hypothetical protein
MSETSGPRSGIMHAVLREIEPRLFRAEYSGEINPQNPDERKIPDFMSAPMSVRSNFG